MSYLDNIDKIFYICVSEDENRKARMQAMINLLFDKNKTEIRWTSKNKLAEHFIDEIRKKCMTNAHDSQYIEYGDYHTYNYIFNQSFNHYDIIKSAYYRGFNRIMICEDDLAIYPICYHLFRNAITNLPENADLVMMHHYDLNIFNEPIEYNYYAEYDTNINNYFYKVDNLVDRWYGSTKCYILSRFGMERMILYYENYLLPSDVYFNIGHNDIFYNDILGELINYYIFKHNNIFIKHTPTESIVNDI